MKIRLSVSLIFLFICSVIYGGFGAGTLVRRNDRYIPVEHLTVGNYVDCYDFARVYTTRPITAVKTKTRSNCLVLVINNCTIVTSRDQLFYCFEHHRWKKAGELVVGDTLLGALSDLGVVQHITELDEPIELYEITVKDCHNFLIAPGAFVVHNFFPQIAFSASCAFGGIEFGGVSVGVAATGTFLGIQLYKDKHKKPKITPIAKFGKNKSNGGGSDKDPDKNKQRKDQQDFLQKKESDKMAEEVGYKYCKQPPFNTHGRPAYKKGNRYITPDRDCHKGGVWKMYEGSKRLGTWNKDLTVCVGG